MEVATWLRSGRRQQLEPVFQGNAIDGHHCKRLAAVPALRWGTGRDAYHRAMANTLARFEGFAAKYLTRLRLRPTRRVVAPTAGS